MWHYCVYYTAKFLFQQSLSCTVTTQWLHEEIGGVCLNMRAVFSSLENACVSITDSGNTGVYKEMHYDIISVLEMGQSLGFCQQHMENWKQTKCIHTCKLCYIWDSDILQFIILNQTLSFESLSFIFESILFFFFFFKFFLFTSIFFFFLNQNLFFVFVLHFLFCLFVLFFLF